MSKIKNFSKFVNEEYSIGHGTMKELVDMKKGLSGQLQIVQGNIDKIVDEFGFTDLDDLLSSSNLEAKDEVKEYQKELVGLEDSLEEIEEMIQNFDPEDVHDNDGE